MNLEQRFPIKKPLSFLALTLAASGINAEVSSGGSEPIYEFRIKLGGTVGVQSFETLEQAVDAYNIRHMDLVDDCIDRVTARGLGICTFYVAHFENPENNGRKINDFYTRYIFNTTVTTESLTNGIWTTTVNHNINRPAVNVVTYCPVDTIEKVTHAPFQTYKTCEGIPAL